MLSLQPAPDEARHFEFKLDSDEVLIVDKYQDIRVHDGRTWTSREEKNRIVLKVRERLDDAAVLEGSFHTYSRSPREVGEYRRDQDFASIFKIAVNGSYEVPERYIMPNLRGLPTFPERALRPGDEWSSEAMETMDFGSTKIKIPLKVRYRYTGPAKLTLPGGSEAVFDRIEYTYSFQHPGAPPAGIARVTGTSACELWFDREAGIPVFDSNRIIYAFTLKNGRTQEMLYRIDSWYRKDRITNGADRKRLAADIRNDLQAGLPEREAENTAAYTDRNQDISVRESDEGVILSLDSILFDHNSAELTAEAQSRLAVIAGILKKHANREVRISGHTDSTGSPEYNTKLSENRARSVVRSLQNEHGVDGRRLSYRGYGETKPVADNATEEGRQKNRRVEVLIVTE